MWCNKQPVTLSYEATADTGGRITITASSSLPDGAELMAGLFSDAGYNAQNTQFLDDGMAIFGPFSDDGARVPAGSYNLSISMSIAGLQSAAVRDYIGESSELMTGPLVVPNTLEGESHVSLDTVLTVS